MKRITIAYLVFISCGAHDDADKQATTTIDRDTVIGINYNADTSKAKDFGLGVLLVKDSEWGDTTKILLYNGDGSLWRSLHLSLLSNSDSTDFFAYSADNFLLILKCTGKNDLLYEVVVDEASGSKKYIKRNDPLFEFQAWDKHILTVFSVDFNEKLNPIRKEPKTGASVITKDTEEFYHPVLVNGKWLKIKWGYEGDWRFGWIRWRDDDKLLVELFYFA